ncbi:MAG: RES family NAD+ phosphorylase [Acidobacteriota bacterium]|nr:RES family NAD+ phosphorylase [Acidobacteriota bacterium]
MTGKHKAGREAGVWGDIAEAFSKPVTLDEPHSDYVPTQILGESFRNCGYDGIVYKSFLNPEGFNVALFDLASADLMNCGLYKTNSLS